MYCTGGVRCERASMLLKSQLGDAVKGVYQLQVRAKPRGNNRSKAFTDLHLKAEAIIWP